MKIKDRIDRLSKLVSGSSQAEFESTGLELSPQESRLYEYLRENGEVNTIEIRQNCAIGNVSSAAMFFNRKFEEAGLGVRIVCETRRMTNRFGHRTQIGWWRIEEADLHEVGEMQASLAREITNVR